MTDHLPRFPDLDVCLTETDGNVFAVLAAVRKALRLDSQPPAVVEEFTTEATSGDYDHALQTCMRWVSVS